MSNGLWESVGAGVRTVFVIVMLVAVGGLLFFVSTKMDRKPSHDAAVQAACNDALLLADAELRVQARREIHNLRRDGHRDRCPEFDRRPLYRRDRAAGVADARAATLRRAARIASPRSARRNGLLVRAVRAQIVVAARLPYDAAARRQLSRAISDVRMIDRCRLAQRLVDARLFAHANAVAGELLGEGRGSPCVRRAAIEARERQARALVLLEQARGEPRSTRAGRQRARRLTLRALAADPAVAAPARVLEGLPPIPVRRFTVARRLRDNAATVIAAVAGAAAWGLGLVGGLVLLVAVGVIVAVLGSRALVVTCERSKLSRTVLDVLPAMRRYTRTRLTLWGRGGFEEQRDGALATIADTFVLPSIDPEVPKGRQVAQSRYPLDQIDFSAPAQGRLVPLASVLGGFPALEGVAAVFGWAHQRVARQEIRVECLFMSKTMQGFGLRLEPRDWRGRAKPVITLRQTEYAPGQMDDGEAFHQLAVVAAGWLRKVVG